MALVSRIEINRGRQDEFERTDTGTAVIELNDVGETDQTNTAELIATPVALAIRNPVTEVWYPLFRGIVDDYTYALDDSQVVGRARIECVDLFDYLSNFNLATGLAGTTPPTESEAYVYYPQSTSDGFQQRINEALDDASVPTSQRSIFTGNIHMPATVYGAGESIMTVIMDAADAEFPTVANVYIDTRGFIQAHGRYARFDPDAVSASATHWNFTRWKAGDGAAVVADPTKAQIRPPFAYARSRGFIRNLALAYPKDILDADMAGQWSTEPTSIADFGARTWSAENLLVLEGTTTHKNANDECKLYADYIVNNYSQPQNRVPQISFRSLLPDDPRADATWALICGVDISDVVEITIAHPGGGGFIDADFFVEGVHYVLEPLQGDLDTGYPDVTLTLDLSPVAYWTDSPFGPFA